MSQFSARHFRNLLFPRRIAAPEFSRGFQPTGRPTNVSASRERRLNSIVADATGKNFHVHRGLKPTAKFRRRDAAGGGPPPSPPENWLINKEKNPTIKTPCKIPAESVPPRVR